MLYIIATYLVLVFHIVLRWLIHNMLIFVQLLFTKWRAVTARPPSLIGKLDLFGTLQDHLEQLRIFLNKLTKICAFAKADENVSL